MSRTKIKRWKQGKKPNIYITHSSLLKIRRYGSVAFTPPIFKLSLAKTIAHCITINYQFPAFCTPPFSKEYQNLRNDADISLH